MGVSSQFPNVRLSGVFLTEGLKDAFLLPLIAWGTENEERVLLSGDLKVSIENSRIYKANGYVVFDRDQYIVQVVVRPATFDQMKSRELDAAHLYPNPPYLFEGVGTELYREGTLEHIAFRI